MKHIVDEANRGMRLDRFVLELFPELSRAFVQRLNDEGKILVNDEALKGGHRLRVGQVVTIDFNPDDLEKIESIDLPIIYEDDNVFVIDKPAGVISHARGRFWNEPSVASFVREKSGQKGERAGIVHRLDRATSGLMICAKNTETMAYLQKQFADRTVEKIYVAVIQGHLDPPAAVIDIAITRNPSIPKRFMAHSNGKSAQTVYKTLKSDDKHSKLELIPKTGRTHQLRVHLEYMRHPIVGDELYDGEPADRLYLHAGTLKIELPGKGQMTFTAPEPPEFNEIFERS